MTESSKTGPSKEGNFEQVSQNGRGGGVVSDFFAFMKENAKWWLLPILIVFGLLGVLLIVGASGAAPFIYTLF